MKRRNAWFCRFFPFLLSLFLACPALAMEGRDYPEKGEVMEGFEVLEVRPCAALGAELILMEHQKTGAKLFWCANDDVNRTFALAFATVPIDNTGLPHVFEHACLSGCEKYPSAELFFNLIYQTYQTYMNAFTQDRMTFYPIASLSQEQLLKLADYYIDSCFHPSILNEESIYRTEAWRYRLEKEEDPLTIEGTVYSEMLGATTLDWQANMNLLATAFPGSVIGYDYGGHPEDIPDMTWENLKNYHELFYHPSNCSAYLYGDLENYQDFLALLDAEFSKYEKKDFIFEDENYEPLTESCEASFAFPVEASSEASHKSVISYAWVLDEEADADYLALSQLAGLFGSSSGTLYQDLQKKVPYASFSSGLEIAGPSLALIFTLSEADPEDAPILKESVEAAISEVARKGFAPEMASAFAAQLNTDNLLLREHSSLGVLLLESAAYEGVIMDNPFAFFEDLEENLKIKENNEKGVFAALCEKYLREDAITALAVTYPVSGLKEENDQKEEERLAEVKASLSEEEIQKLIADTNAEKETNPDTAKMVEELTAVTVDSLPEEYKLYDIKDEVDEENTRRMDISAQVEGIGLVTVLLPADFLSAEDLMYLKLYKDLLPYLNTEEHTVAELMDLMNRYQYGTDTSVSINGAVGEEMPYIAFAWISLDENLQMGYDLMKEQFFHAVLSQEEMAQGISSLLSETRSVMQAAPQDFMLEMAKGRFSKPSRIVNNLSGAPYYAFLLKADEILKENPQELIGHLTQVRDSIYNRNGSIVLYAGNEESIALNREVSDGWFSDFSVEEREPSGADFPIPAKNVALIVDSNVQYNGILADYETLGVEGYDYGQEILASFINDRYLYPILRDTYGVYSIHQYPIMDVGYMIRSYRDPNVTVTYDVYGQLAEKLENLEITQEEVDQYILSVYSSLALPSGELFGAIEAGYSLLDGKDQKDIFTYMKQCKAMTPEKLRSYAPFLEKLSLEGGKFVAGGAAAVMENADLFDEILNPFGVEDLSDMELSDVPEEDEDADVIRATFEAGFLSADEKGAIRPDEEALTGDVASFLYALLGGSRDPEEALAALSQAGLFAPEAEVGDVPTREEVAGVLASLMAMSGEELEGGKVEVSVTDEVSPEMLWALSNGLMLPKEVDGKEVSASEEPLLRRELARLIYVIVLNEEEELGI